MYSERKIDDIVRNVSLIKTALQGSIPENHSNNHHVSPETTSQSVAVVSASDESERTTKRQTVQLAKQKNASSWDHSVQIIEFVKSVAESSTPIVDNGLASSLKRLGHAMTNPSSESQLPGITALSGSQPQPSPVPPLGIVLPLLRWVKGT